MLEETCGTLIPGCRIEKEKQRDFKAVITHMTIILSVIFIIYIFVVFFSTLLERKLTSFNKTITVFGTTTNFNETPSNNNK